MFDYCDVVWYNLDQGLATRIQKLQNRSARVIIFQGYDVRSAQIRKQLNWEELASRRQRHLGLLMYDTVPWSQRFFLIFLRERDQQQAAKLAATTSRKSDEEREKNLWLPWPRISLSCRRQGQDLNLRRWLVDSFSNTQNNLIGSFNCNYRGDAEDFTPHFASLY